MKCFFTVSEMSHISFYNCEIYVSAGGGGVGGWVEGVLDQYLGIDKRE